ncbi:haloacid dehalogenase [Paraliobacillus quinghaiensis]|uniref:Haloacid dehalogenase n=1 Tax=Paraliobacillus quinghaiensis TaxID=470815 RepID=A0A917TUP0_9BACI|nr:HAD family hydrolase [Paraliobacillus quinghaiensis]GGM38232.1 haloacid dehalogenase [Paraliobacillus quinghaiensis]
MDSIIFDLDGTLWDSRDAVVLAWNKVLSQNKVNKELTRDDFKRTMGLPFEEVSKTLLPDVDKEVVKKVLDDTCEVENVYLSEQGGLLYDDVEDVLKTLSQHYELYIVSNCQDGYIEAFYQYHGLGKYFFDYENPGRTGLSKGDNIKLIIERNQLLNPVYVGDTNGDLQAAEHAGIPFIYAKYGFGEVTEYEHAVDRFDELLGMFM